MLRSIKTVFNMTFFLMITTAIIGQGITVNDGTRLLFSGGNLVIAGSLTNNGGFHCGSGTVTFNGKDQAVGGSSVSVFDNVMIATGSTTTLQSSQDVAGILTVNGALYSNGFLTLTSSESKTALVNGAGSGQIYENVTMQRYLPSKFGYKYMSSPFQSATVGELSDDINLALSSTTLYGYDESRLYSGWFNYKSVTNILNPLTGYAVNMGSNTDPGTIDITGTVSNGNLSLALFNNNRTYTRGYNLVGNPYPSPIDWYAPSGWTRTNIDDALYFFKASATDQYGGLYSTLIEGISSDGLASNIIPSMQGFFVHVSDGAYPVAGTLQMNNSVRVTSQSSTLIKGEKGTPLIRFSAGFSDKTGLTDYSVLYFDEKSGMEFDGRLDALKLMNTDLNVPNMYFVTPGEVNLQIYALPPALNTLWKIPLGLKLGKNGTVVIKIRDIDSSFASLRISITDELKGTEQLLVPGTGYSIPLSTGEYKNRFFLNVAEIVTAIPEERTEEDLTIYYSRNTLNVNMNSLNYPDAILTVCNLLGQTLFTRKIPSEGIYNIDLNLKDGVYLATLTSGKFRTTKKISIRNK